MAGLDQFAHIIVLYIYFTVVNVKRRFGQPVSLFERLLSSMLIYFHTYNHMCITISFVAAVELHLKYFSLILELVHEVIPGFAQRVGYNVVCEARLQPDICFDNFTLLKPVLTIAVPMNNIDASLRNSC